jgi:P27 family predicted phage terminase small subunit
MKGTKPQLKQDRAAIKRVPKPPDWLSTEAKAEWKRVMPLLIERRILTDADLGTLENYCVAMGQVRQLEKLVQKTFVLRTESGAFKPAPWVKQQEGAMTRALRLAAELGLTPVSRSRPAIRDAEDNDNDLDNPLAL